MMLEFLETACPSKYSSCRTQSFRSQASKRGEMTHTCSHTKAWNSFLVAPDKIISILTTPILAYKAGWVNAGCFVTVEMKNLKENREAQRDTTRKVMEKEWVSGFFQLSRWMQERTFLRTRHVTAKKMMFFFAENRTIKPRNLNIVMSAYVVAFAHK